jgi:hypothetical protein
LEKPLVRENDSPEKRASRLLPSGAKRKIAVEFKEFIDGLLPMAAKAYGLLIQTTVTVTIPVTMLVKYRPRKRRIIYKPCPHFLTALL